MRCLVVVLLLVGCGAEEEPLTFCEAFATALCEIQACETEVTFEECYPSAFNWCFTFEVEDRDVCRSALNAGGDWCAVGLPPACH